MVASETPVSSIPSVTPVASVSPEITAASWASPVIEVIKAFLSLLGLLLSLATNLIKLALVVLPLLT